MGVVKQLAKGRSESPRDKEGSGAVYWRFWLFFLRAEARTPAQGPRLGRWQAPGWLGCGQARRLTPRISQMEDPFFFPWMICSNG